MARRNLFQPPALPASSATEAPAPDKSRFPNTGAMSGVKSTLKDLSSNAVREIAPDLIEEDGPKDRLAFADADVAQLAESIRQHGQQVPIMVRPMAEKPGSYRIVYGRRRLRALRLLGQPAKALVRALSDDEAILAQGQENAQRLDPSFIEKSLFAAELAASGYETAVILDALAVDKPMLSRMQKVARSIPEAVVREIGPAHGIGRRRWEDLADLVNNHDLDLVALVQDALAPASATSDGRFAQIADAAAAAVRQTASTTKAPSPALPVLSEDGRRLAQVSDQAKSVTVKLSKTEAPEFAMWWLENAEAELQRLYKEWQSARKAD